MTQGAAPPPLEESLATALQAVRIVHEAVREAQERVSVSYRSATQAKETRIAAALHPIAERLQAARGQITFARMRLGGLLSNVKAREARRQRRQPD